MKEIKKIQKVLVFCLTFTLTLVIMMGMGTCASSTSEQEMPSYTWTAALNVAPTTINYMIVEKFADLIHERSNGKITVEIYPSGQLGSDSEMNQGVYAGSIDIASAMTTTIVDFVPEMALFDLPNLFPSVEVMRKVLQSDFSDILNEYIRKGGFTMLGYSDAGFRQLTSNKEIRTFKDIAGMKIRTMLNENHIAYWKAIGANPLAMDFGEVFMALQQGTIDGQENPYMNIVGNNFHEVQKYIIETNHIGHIITFYMNNNLYQGLPDNARELVDECAKEAIAYGNSKSDESLANYKKTCIDAGCEIITLSKEDLQSLQDAASVVYDMVRNRLGDELVDTLLAAVEAAK